MFRWIPRCSNFRQFSECRARSDSGAPLKGSSEPSDTALPGSSPDSIVTEILSIWENHTSLVLAKKCVGRNCKKMPPVRKKFIIACTCFMLLAFQGWVTQDPNRALKLEHISTTLQSNIFSLEQSEEPEGTVYSSETPFHAMTILIWLYRCEKPKTRAPTKKWAKKILGAAFDSNVEI